MKPAAVLALALVAAGCVSVAPQSPGPATGAGAWALDCSLGVLTDAWAEPCAAQVSAKPYSQAETWIAVDPTDGANVIVGAKDMDPALSNDCVWTSYGVTHNGGASWTEWVPGGLFAERTPPDPTFGYACNTDPLAVFGPDGTLYAVQDLYAAGASPNSVVAATARMQLYASDDAGATWPRSAMLMIGESATFAPDYPRATVSPTTGTVFVSFIDFLAGERCYVTASDDQGATARMPVIVPVQGSIGCMEIEASPAGTVVVAGPLMENGRLGGFTGGTWFARSTDDGATFTTPAPGPRRVGIEPFEENGFNTGSNLEMAYDRSGGPHHGRLYLVTAQDEGGDSGVFIAWSDDDGATWSDWTRVNQGVDSADQWMGNVVVAEDGSVHVAFMDKRFDPANKLIDVLHAMSLDGGATWTETRLTHVSFDGDLGRHQNSNDVTGDVPFIGDYLGIDSAGGDVWVGFPTSHFGGPPVMAASRLTTTAP